MNDMRPALILTKAMRHDSDTLLSGEFCAKSQGPRLKRNLLLSIFMRLSEPDMRAARQVCRHWREVAEHPSLPGPQKRLGCLFARLQDQPLRLADKLRNPAALEALAHAEQVVLGPTMSRGGDPALTLLAEDDEMADVLPPPATAYFASVLQTVAQRAGRMDTLFCGWEGAGAALHLSAMYLRPNQLRRLTLHFVAAHPAHLVALLGQPGAGAIEHLDVGFGGIDGLRHLAIALSASPQALGGALTSLTLTDSHDENFGLSVVPYLKSFTQLRDLTMGRCLQAPSREDGASPLDAHIKHLSTVTKLSLPGGVAIGDLVYATSHPAFGAVRDLNILLEENIDDVFGQSWPPLGPAMQDLQHLTIGVHNPRDFAGLCAALAKRALSPCLSSLDLFISPDQKAQLALASSESERQAWHMHLHRGLASLAHAKTLTALHRLVVAGIHSFEAAIFSPLFSPPFFPQLSEVRLFDPPTAPRSYF